MMVLIVVMVLVTGSSAAVVQEEQEDKKYSFLAQTTTPTLQLQLVLLVMWMKMTREFDTEICVVLKGEGTAIRESYQAYAKYYHLTSYYRIFSEIGCSAHRNELLYIFGYD